MRLTTDPNTFFFFLDNLAEEPPFRLAEETTWDTNLEKGIDWGIRMVEKDEELHGRSSNAQLFVAITDGEFWSGEVAEALKRAIDRRIPVFVIGVGTLGGGRMPAFVAPEGEDVEPDPDIPLFSRLDRAVLQKIALAGGGQYFELDREGDRQIANAIVDTGKRLAPSLGITEEAEELYWRFLAAAAFFAGAGALFLRERSELWIQLTGVTLALVWLGTSSGSTKKSEVQGAVRFKVRDRFKVLGARFTVLCSVLGSRFPVRRPAAGLALAVAGSAALLAQAPAQPDWKALEAETLAHFQSLVRIETMDPPGREELAADYVVQVLKKEGIPTQTFTLEAGRTNVVARLKGSGRRRPLLLMGHLDTVNVDPTKWTFPPFSAARDGGYVYGRGTVDDKDNVTASLMTMLLLKRLNVPLDRDVIFLAEAGEEGSTRIGIQFMVDQHFAEIDAEYCIAEGGGVTRIDGRARYASVQTLEKIPRQIQLTARGVAGHGSVPLKTNAILNLAGAVSAVGLWQPPVRLNETTGAYFKRLADISSPEEAKRYLAALSLDPKVTAEVANWFFEHEPRHASMLRIVAVSKHLHRRVPRQRHPVRSHRHDRRAPAPGRGPGQVPRDRPRHRQQSGHRRQLRRALPPADAGDTPRLARARGDRSGRQAPLRHRHPADDEHGRHGHGVSAPERHAVLRGRTGDRPGGWPEGLRRAQRPGTDPRSRALPVRAVLLGRHDSNCRTSSSRSRT